MSEPSHQITQPALVPSVSNHGQSAPTPWSRKIIALLIAIAADAPPLALFGESFPLVFDVGVAALLWLVLGRSRLLAMALVVECIPGIGLAPTWSLYVLWEIFFSKPGSGAQKSAQSVLSTSQK